MITKRQIRTIALLVSFVFIGEPTFTQTPHQKDHQEKDDSRIQSMKVAYITNELDLKPEEARKFWPVYNEWQNKEEEAWQDFKDKTPDRSADIDELSDQQLNNIIDAHIGKKQKKADLQRQYLKEIKKVLPLPKVAKLLHAEHSFKRHLLDKRCADGPGNSDE